MDGGWTIHRYDTVDSTQHVAAALIAAGAPHRTAVVARQQSAGYGRKADPWQDLPDSSLLTTLILRPPRSLMPHSQIYAMMAALAVVDAIAATAGGTASVKWPNDLLLGGRKVAGILGDAVWTGGQLTALRIGVGVNVAGDAATFMARGLPDATSIIGETGQAVSVETVFRSFLAAFARWDDLLVATGHRQIISRWRAALRTLGLPVRASLTDGGSLQGIAHDVTDAGDLLVRADVGGIVRLDATRVRSLRHLDRPDGA